MENVALKVEVHMLMDILHNLYHSGVDFIDLSIKKNENDQISIYISYHAEYIDPEFLANFEPQDKPATQGKIELTDNDINQLI